MSRNTMSVAVPEPMQEFIDSRVRSGEYGNASEYVRDLIRRDQREQAIRELHALVAEGLASGEARPLDDEYVAELRSAISPEG